MNLSNLCLRAKRRTAVSASKEHSQCPKISTVGLKICCKEKSKAVA